MTGPSPRRLKWQRFALSFTALFLEMMVIRWVPSVVKLIAFYANLMLLSSFLGLGVAYRAGRHHAGGVSAVEAVGWSVGSAAGLTENFRRKGKDEGL